MSTEPVNCGACLDVYRCCNFNVSHGLPINYLILLTACTTIVTFVDVIIIIDAEITIYGSASIITIIITDTVIDFLVIC